MLTSQQRAACEDAAAASGFSVRVSAAGRITPTAQCQPLDEGRRLLIVLDGLLMAAAMAGQSGSDLRATFLAAGGAEKNQFECFAEQIAFLRDEGGEADVLATAAIYAKQAGRPTHSEVAMSESQKKPKKPGGWKPGGPPRTGGKAGSPCRTCNHPRRREIERDHALGGNRTHMARKFAISVDAMARHMKDHLTDEQRAEIVAKARSEAAQKVAATLDVADVDVHTGMKRVVAEIDGILQRAKGTRTTCSPSAASRRCGSRSWISPSCRGS